MIAIQLPAPDLTWSCQVSNEVTFRIVSDADVTLLTSHYGRGMNIKTGDLLIILSMAMWSTYTICLRWRPPKLDMISFLFALCCVGELVMLPFYLGEAAFGRHVVWSWTVVLALFGIGLFPSVVAYIFWNRGVEQVGAPVAGLFVHLMPVFGIVLAWLFLDERLRAFHMVGIALILTGIWITSRKQREPIVAAPE